MAKQMTFSLLDQAVGGSAAALRSITKLQPVGGAGDKFFPATYSGGSYATEKRRLPGEEALVDCVLVNSVQSEANHAELALKDAYEEGSIRIPIIEVDLSQTSDFEKRDQSDDRRIVCLCRAPEDRKLDLRYPGNRFDDRYVLAGVLPRSSS